MKTYIALATAWVVATSLHCAGQTISWNLGGSGGHGSSDGNTISITESGVRVTVSAWSHTLGYNDTAFEEAALGQWSVGIGVVNPEESDSSPWHQTDNYRQNDYLLFVFDRLVDIRSVTITPSPGPYDQDVSYWVGNISGTDLEGLTYADLALLGFMDEQVVSGSYSSSSKVVSINAPSSGVNAILFGPERGLETDSYYIDAFKSASITASIPLSQVPEPSSALLSLLGALVACFRRRR